MSALTITALGALASGLFATSCCERQQCPDGWRETESFCEPPDRVLDQATVRLGTGVLGFRVERECSDEACLEGCEGIALGEEELRFRRCARGELGGFKCSRGPVAAVTTNRDGTFELALPPGIYVEVAGTSAFEVVEGSVTVAKTVTRLD